MKQKPIKPIKGTEKIFKIYHKRIETGVSEKNKTGKTYDLIKDLDTTKLNYQKIIESLPAQPGIIILTGHYKNTNLTLEIIKSDENIRAAFSRNPKQNRYRKLLEYLNENNFDHIQIQLALAS